MAAMFRATRLSRPPAASSQCPLEAGKGSRESPWGGVSSLLQEGWDCSHTWEQIPP